MRLLMLMLRKSLAVASFVVAAATFSAGAAMRTQWHFDAEAAVNWITGMLILVLPLVAGIAAYDFQRHARGLLRSGLGRSLAIHRLLSAIWIPHVVAVLSAWFVVCTVGVVVTVANGSSPAVSWPVVLHPIALMIVAPMIGVTVALVLPRPWTPVVVALGLFLVTIIAENVGPYDRVLSALGFSAWDPYTGLVTSLVLLKTAVLVVGALALVSVWWVWTAVGQRRRVMRGVAITGGVAAAVMLGVVGATQPPGLNGVDQHVVDAASLTCVGENPQFCTDENERVAHELRAAALDAYLVLEPYGVRPPAVYADERALRAPDESRGLWAIDVPSAWDAELKASTTSITVARPTACEAYYMDAPNADHEQILAGSEVVQSWTYALVTAGSEDGAALLWPDLYPEIPWDSMIAQGGHLHAALGGCDSAAAADVLETLMTVAP